jgi:hypothetical protein
MSNGKVQSSNEIQNPNDQLLEERTGKFAEDIIEFAKTLEFSHLSFICHLNFDI